MEYYNQYKKELNFLNLLTLNLALSLHEGQLFP
ncbi:hypothetical protein BV058_00874 [Haemophilus influenzae]|nr:hypothetical protein BVZ56_00753 [Haemophilus influenzae]PRI42735.1 hypothetical protein BVZ70_00497 [Haemophilus influenzae]PRJ51632.1 hypothetical protein BV094_00535 [Haemophilus influenzae]PRJ71660.1 hypothetical protein BV115_00316 [Haemophilus influenzae]PRJ96453.1 hypothetical protein BV166_01478 [Haemophilus influenzae]